VEKRTSIFNQNLSFQGHGEMTKYLPCEGKEHWNPGGEANYKIPGPLLYLKGWFGAMAGQDDPVIIPTKQ
jgi:hypothetical protein